MTQLPWLATLEEFESNLGRDGEDFWIGISHGSMRVELFAPKLNDTQQPHDQDEMYIVLRGTAAFQKNGTTVDVSAGDVMFVEAAMPHRFTRLSDDFATWVVFWGRKGGEI